jgi:hypothetical protein
MTRELRVGYLQQVLSVSWGEYSGANVVKNFPSQCDTSVAMMGLSTVKIA